MVKPRTGSKFRLFSRLLLPILAFFVIVFNISVASVPVTAQYGACNYSESTFSHNDSSCGQQTSGGSLGSTGEDRKLLLFAALGLLAGAAGITALVLILRRAHKRKKDQLSPKL